ncbi:MAG: hypothetical protein GY849_02070 [Deltaproteobacteria bacterium]|nr:hypothetical protein [Deltaproteobacteria bacterium]
MKLLEIKDYIEKLNSDDLIDLKNFIESVPIIYPLPNKNDIQLSDEILYFEDIRDKYEKQFNHSLFCEKIEKYFKKSIENVNFTDRGCLIVYFKNANFNYNTFYKFRNSEHYIPIINILHSCL